MKATAQRPERLAAGILLAACAAAAAAERPDFAPHRYDEDWQAFCGRAGLPATDRLKCLPLSGGGQRYLSLGGEWRERFEAVDAPDFGIGTRSDRYTLHRLLLHADLHLGGGLRLFTQLGAYAQSGRDGGPTPSDQSDPDLQQGFADLAFALGSGRATLRAGRQELSLGSSRLVSVRESPNLRRAFDGVRGFWSGGGWRLDAFQLRPVRNEPGAFDDRRHPQESLRGLQLALTPSPPGGVLETYYLDYERGSASFAAGSAAERRRSLGLRWYGRWERLDWNIEAIGQNGRHGSDAIRAWTVASDSGYRLPSWSWRPRLGLKANIASGDGDLGDGRLQTFNALYPNPTYFSEASLVAPANFIDLQPTLTLYPSDRLTLALGWNLLRKQRQADAVYLTPSPATPLAGSTGGSSEIGQQFRFEPMWKPTPRLELRAAYVHFEAGAAIRQAGGSDVDFGMLSAAWRF
ncbi:alginate export family protein [Solimonas sp. K1W22B-7]|uniref:alginate export family protein n=1 Tax=Solimonas sp. K1W22B-7 TaxID=2303331 RepID=UPI000E32F6CC|nr:alginate export family protein [Solimonas sp. K1W22B-7]AXQ27519.1 alginate export family protein [Solimonas sp. K1W22B-7]